MKVRAVAGHGKGHAYQLGCDDTDSAVVRQLVFVALLSKHAIALGDIAAPVTSDQPHDASAILGPAPGQMGDTRGVVGRFGDTGVQAEPGDDTVDGSEPKRRTQFSQEGGSDDGAKVGDLGQVLGERDLVEAF